MFSASTPKKSRLSVSDHTPGLTAILSNETNSAVEESVFEESVFSSALPGNPCESKDILNESVFEESVISAVLPGNLSEGKNVLDESVFEESIISTVLPSNLSGGNEDNSVFEESVLSLVLPSHPIEANDILDESVFEESAGGSTFSKCDDCVRIQQLLQSTQNPISRKEIMAEKQRHISTVMTERLAYYARVRRAQTNPNRYVSLIVDGMDQTK
ncbi:uncharacterized protein LOC141910475 [Tubulanus polymorphus]|uniref:uncharacterized protein LOC141910475 n=1 Tax=Tubulanus polymorphus TaxID=672921 RepID=UPI003DA4275D